MRSGWPHTGDGQGMMPADQRGATFGPDVSWPAGHSQGSHPYAAFSAAGYGDDGYSDPVTRGRPRRTPGITGTRTVRGFVESGQQQQGYAYPATGYAQLSPGGTTPRAPAARPMAPPSYRARSPGTRSRRPTPGTASPATPDRATRPAARSSWRTRRRQARTAAATATTSRGITTSRFVTTAKTTPTQAVRPLRVPRPGQWRRAAPAARLRPRRLQRVRLLHAGRQRPGLRPDGHHRHERLRGGRLRRAELRAPLLRRPRTTTSGATQGRRTPARWRGSTTPGSTICGWPGDDVRRESGPMGYGNDGFGDTRPRSAPPTAPPGLRVPWHRRRRGTSAETRLRHEGAGRARAISTRFDVPRYDETRIDNLRPTPAGSLRATATAVLAPPACPAAQLGRGHVARPLRRP